MPPASRVPESPRTDFPISSSATAAGLANAGRAISTAGGRTTPRLAKRRAGAGHVARRKARRRNQPPLRVGEVLCRSFLWPSYSGGLLIPSAGRQSTATRPSPCGRSTRPIRRARRRRPLRRCFFLASRDGKLFAGDGGDPGQVAFAPDGQRINAFTPQPDATARKAGQIGQAQRSHRAECDDRVRWQVGGVSLEHGGSFAAYAAEVAKAAAAA